MADRRRRRRGPDPPDPDDPTRQTDPERVSSTLAAFATRRGWQGRLEAAQVHTRWEEIAGQQLARHCQPVRLAGGVLVVSVTSSAWATEVTYLVGDLMERANVVLGEGTVRRVTITTTSACR